MPPETAGVDGDGARDSDRGGDRGFTYYSAGEDTLSDVPPIKTARGRQETFESLRESTPNTTADAYDDAARLTEAYRIWRRYRRLLERPDPDTLVVGLRTVAVWLAFAGGVAMPAPPAPPTDASGFAAVVAAAQATVDALLSIRGLVSAGAILACLILLAIADARFRSILYRHLLR